MKAYGGASSLQYVVACTVRSCGSFGAGLPARPPAENPVLGYLHRARDRIMEAYHVRSGWLGVATAIPHAGPTPLQCWPAALRLPHALAADIPFHTSIYQIAPPPFTPRPPPTQCLFLLLYFISHRLACNLRGCLTSPAHHSLNPSPPPPQTHNPPWPRYRGAANRPLIICCRPRCRRSTEALTTRLCWIWRRRWYTLSSR